jgi:hypothetical protein
LKVEPDKQTHHWLDWFLAIWLVIFSLPFFAAGRDAIRQRHYEAKWNARAGFGPVSKKSSGVVVYEGKDAVSYGIGLLGFSVMLSVWGFGFSSKHCSDYGWFPFHERLITIYYSLSFIGLLTAIVGTHPLWRKDSWWFYVPFTLISVLITLRVFEQPLGQYANYLIPLLAVTAFVVFAFSPSAFGSVVMALFAAIAFLGNLAYVYGSFYKRFLADDDVCATHQSGDV